MRKLPFDKTDGQNFTVVYTGKWTDLDKYVFKHVGLPGAYPGKLFLKNALNLTGMEVSLNKLPPGTQMPFSHTHKKNEELYIFVRGRGQFQIDGEIVDVSEGTAIRVAPGGVRTWRNNSSENLYFIVVQSRAESLPGEDISDGVGVRCPIEWSEPVS